MPEQKISTVQAKIASIGDIVQITAKYSKFSFEYTVGDSQEVLNAESPKWFRDKLEVGNTYEFTLKANPAPDGDYYTPSIDSQPVLLTGNAVNGAKPNPPAAEPSKKPAPAVAVSEKQTSGRRPELNSRWREFSSHVRLGQMQATERVGQYIQLAIAGRLVTDEDEPIKNLRKSTIESWYSEEIDRYWKELDVLEPSDWFGNMRIDS
jgi:hypothetical protein